MKTSRRAELVLIVSLMISAAPAFGEVSSGDDDWESGNLVLNGNFLNGSSTNLPEGWTAVCPNPAIAPEFRAEVAPDGRHCLEALGTGRSECFGYVCHKVHMEGGKTYRFRVQLRAEGLADLNRHLVHEVFGSFNDGIFRYQKRDAVVIGEGRFLGPKKAEDAEVRLYFRFSPTGKVWWERVSLQECGPIAPRFVKVACSLGGGDLAHWEKWLDRAGEKWVDLALLPEMFNGKSPKQAEALNGPSGLLLAQKAKQWRMYVAASFYEKRADLVLNTAPLFDRDGKLVGSYSKNEVYDPEEDEGVSPGTELPVFDADFGKVGIMICYDSWFPEVTRLLAYRGAELVPVAQRGLLHGTDAGARCGQRSVDSRQFPWHPGRCVGPGRRHGGGKGSRSDA